MDMLSSSSSSTSPSGMNHRDEFIEVYTALVLTLRKTHKVCEDIMLPTVETVSPVALELRQDLALYLPNMKSRDASIMLQNIRCLQKLQIPLLWVQNDLTSKSKELIWEYLLRLYNLSDFVTTEVSRLSGKSGDQEEEDPFDLKNAPPMLKKMIKAMRPETLDKMRDMARKIGDRDPSQVNIGELMGDMMKEFNMSDLQRIASQFSS